MAEIVSQGQAALGQRRRLIEAFVVMVAAGAIVIAVAWAAAALSAPRVIPLDRTPAGYLQAPGLVEQRAGERGVVSEGAAGTFLDPSLTQQRQGEHQGD